MPFQRALLVLFCASVALAEQPELRPLKGDKVKGDLVEISDKAIVLQVNGKPVTTPLEGVLRSTSAHPAIPTAPIARSS